VVEEDAHGESWTLDNWTLDNWTLDNWTLDNWTLDIGILRYRTSQLSSVQLSSVQLSNVLKPPGKPKSVLYGVFGSIDVLSKSEIVKNADFRADATRFAKIPSGAEKLVDTLLILDFWIATIF